jgi:hypothetical protein
MHAMTTEFDRITDLIERPGESLSVEIKSWIDPASEDGQQKLIRGTLALRNHGGGYLIIGFDDQTLQASRTNVPNDVKTVFHQDIIQALVTRFSSEPFEVIVHFPEKDGQFFPVIAVPPGVRTPVAAKSDLISKENQTKLISTDDVYVRTLRSNNTPSTAKASWKDWPKVVEVCFDNREADIGRFFRRHLSGLKSEQFAEFVNAINGAVAPAESVIDKLQLIQSHGAQRYEKALKESGVKLDKHGTWEVCVAIQGEIPEHKADRQFFNLLDSSNPDFTGWPVWLNSSNFSNESSHPYVFDDGWEALVISIGSNWSDHIDFMRLSPKGTFYLHRALQDDTSGNERSPKPLTQLDFGLPILRTAEAIAVALSFAKAMGCTEEKCSLSFMFKWTHLSGRQLTNWAQPNRFIFPGNFAKQDEYQTTITVPLETPFSAIPDYVNKVVQPLFALFNGFQLNPSIVEDLVIRLIERRL